MPTTWRRSSAFGEKKGRPGIRNSSNGSPGTPGLKRSNCPSGYDPIHHRTAEKSKRVHLRNSHANFKRAKDTKNGFTPKAGRRTANTSKVRSAVFASAKAPAGILR